ncbi:hypothetical protein [Pseudodesulfovibrio sp.]|uniref:hypothetical protein n=1 Tax=unclassified Pseudodesulfovibrio TaxID=2661612 RepID=UPI003B00D78A
MTEQAMNAELQAQMLADSKVGSSPVEVEIVQHDIILLAVISDKEKRAGSWSMPGQRTA